MLSQAIAHHQSGNLSQAQSLYEKIIEINPNHFDALHLLGVIYFQNRSFDAAIELITKSLEINPSSAIAYNNLGNIYSEISQFDDAVKCFSKGITLKPEYAVAHFNLGNALASLSKLDKALTSYGAAIRFQNNYAEAHYNYANTLKDLERYEEAIASYQNLLLLNPNYLEAYCNCGVALKELRQYDEALDYYDKAIALKPDYAEAYNNKGNALKELRQYDEAMAYYDKAIALKPDYADAHFNLGNLNQELNNPNLALINYNNVLAAKKSYPYISGYIFHAKMLLCEWDNYIPDSVLLIKRITTHEKCTPPFPLLSIFNSLNVQEIAARAFSNDKYPTNPSLGPIPRKTKKSRMRVGYFSPDFKMHPVSYLTAEIFELHDKSKFEIFAFSMGDSAPSDPMRKRLVQAFDHFIDVQHMTDKEVATEARRLDIDIAIDLGGYTRDCRPGIFAFQSAPIQISYIGYLGSMQTKYVDYLIADKVIIPEEMRLFYSEKIIYLPSYQANDSKREISNKIFNKQEFGINENQFVFGCFNNNYKITPDIFTVWMRILKAVPNSVLFLCTDNILSKNNLRREASSRSIHANRLIFVDRIPPSEYLSRYKIVDLFLDTSPYNAGTTASDALWAGTPVLTFTGETFSSRVAASLLTAIGLPELIAGNIQEYEKFAINLALMPNKIAAIKIKLLNNRSQAPLFDSKLFVKTLETAYNKAFERHLHNLPLDHIHIT